MRKKELKLVVTFHTTADAMAMEKACKENNTPGRIISVFLFYLKLCFIFFTLHPVQALQLHGLQFQFPHLYCNGKN